MSEFDFQRDPLDSFTDELEWARARGLHEPHAMTLATVTATGFPRARTVLFKGFSDGRASLGIPTSAGGDYRGFRFFTNYESDKARELASGRCALLFHWNTLERQVRVEGRVEKVSRTESEEYFASRPRLSQLGAWSSEQSREIESAEWLQARYESFEARFADQTVPCPPNWGGFRVVPFEIEFWFGRPGRMHDRHGYTRVDESSVWRHFLRSP
jgi:pyridoxamine 5'-phosphate oxidase